jgi:predicted transcriptional regulator
MATTREELESFHQYAARRLNASASEPSLDDLLMEWVDDRERPMIDDAIRRGLADVDAGRHEPADEVMEEIRHEFGFPKE